MASVDFRDQLRRQLGFLQNSCRLFDRGDLEEAIRIATSLRVLFHTTKSSTSLLTHLKGGSCSLLSTVAAISGRREVFALIDMRWTVGVDQPFLALPKLDGATHRRLIPFNEWWMQEAIVSAGGIDGGHATRRDLALWAANKDGGAHVDDELAASYQSVIAGLGMAIGVVGTGEEGFPEGQQVTIPLQDLHLACLRQVAYEVLASPDVLALKN